ncbi:hypothetical protein Barb6_03692 [Bacteroidales bacterium Barb6]|nr:hypothetical protein Barb6_03692 [Bacteroidales bacterium Barb6]
MCKRIPANFRYARRNGECALKTRAHESGLADCLEAFAKRNLF